MRILASTLALTCSFLGAGCSRPSAESAKLAPENPTPSNTPAIVEISPGSMPPTQAPRPLTEEEKQAIAQGEEARRKAAEQNEATEALATTAVIGMEPAAVTPAAALTATPGPTATATPAASATPKPTGPGKSKPRSSRSKRRP